MARFYLNVGCMFFVRTECASFYRKLHKLNEVFFNTNISYCDFFTFTFILNVNHASSEESSNFLFCFGLELNLRFNIFSIVP
jgi:hypothetical protein